MKETIQKYINSGLACLPVKLDKSPDISTSWKGGITDISLYKNGIGIICGQISGGLECLDLDNHQETAKENLSNFIAEIKEIYDKHLFPIISTQSGGYHILYRCSKIEGNKKLASVPILKNERWIPDAIIETRGEGGYFVAAPTEGYKIVRNDILKIPTISEDERNFLISVAKSFNKFSETRKEKEEQTDKPGDQYNNDPLSKTESLDCLIGAGWKVLREGILQRPDKEKGISATFGQVADNIFFNFSVNAYPFESDKAYTPFQVISLLKYNGDFSAFAKELATRYKTEIPTKKTTTEIDASLNKSFIDFDKNIPKPQNALVIRDFNNNKIIEKRVFTLGNFSVINGKSKSKKTYLSNIFLAALVKNDLMFDKFRGTLPETKRDVFLFDTEQGRYDAFTASNRVNKLIGSNYPNYGVFNLREYSHEERLKMIEHTILKFKNSIGFLMIDGVADLVNSFNDELEANKITTLLLKWTKEYNFHICVIIHQNKNDNWATGHLGSALMKKAEAVISVTKDIEDKMKSKVVCDMIRGTIDFDEFVLEINEEGMPNVPDMLNISNQYEIMPF